MNSFKNIGRALRLLELQPFPHMSIQPQYVTIQEQPASAASPSSAGSSEHHVGPSLDVAAGARIEKQALVDWSVSPFVVTALMPRDSGEKGLRIGDRVLSINGESVTHMATSDSLSDLLTGPLGSSVDIVVERVTCAPQPLALSVPRSSIEEHFGAKLVRNHDIICQGWITKDGQFLSVLKRRWAWLYYSDGIFKFCWSKLESRTPIEDSVSLNIFHKSESESRRITWPLDSLPPGKQLSTPCSNFGFLLSLGGRAISIFCDSQPARDLWISVLNMAQRTPDYDGDYVLPGSIVTNSHREHPWILHDDEFEIAITKREEETGWKKVHAAVYLQQEQAQQQLRMQQEQDRVQLQRITESGNLSGGDAIALLQSTIMRVQALELKNDLLQRQNFLLHAETRAQNAVIDHLTAQTKQQQLQDALLFLQVAEALRLLVDPLNNSTGDSLKAWSGVYRSEALALSILTDVTGEQNSHTVGTMRASTATGRKSVGKDHEASAHMDPHKDFRLQNCLGALAALATPASAYHTGVTPLKQRLEDAASSSDQAFQLQLSQRP